VVNYARLPLSVHSFEFRVLRPSLGQRGHFGNKSSRVRFHVPRKIQSTSTTRNGRQVAAKLNRFQNRLATTIHNPSDSNRPVSDNLPTVIRIVTSNGTKTVTLTAAVRVRRSSFARFSRFIPITRLSNINGAFCPSKLRFFAIS